MFHNGPASISTCFNVIDALSMESYVTPKVQILGKYVLLGFFVLRSSVLLYTTVTTSCERKILKMMFKNARCNENEGRLSYENIYVHWSKKSKHHIRLKCIRKELNQTRKYKNNYIYMHVNVSFLTHFISYIKSAIWLL